MKGFSEEWLRGYALKRSSEASELSPAQANTRSRSVGRKRPDLGDVFFRSAWEANFARYLNFLQACNAIFAWEYEADTFWFEQIRRGTRSYTPDFKIWDAPDVAPYYVEIKGWMDQKSKVKLNRMKKFYPNVRVDLICQSEYNAIRDSVSALIPDWEGIKATSAGRRRR